METPTDVPERSGDDDTSRDSHSHSHSHSNDGSVSGVEVLSGVDEAVADSAAHANAGAASGSAAASAAAVDAAAPDRAERRRLKKEKKARAAARRAKREAKAAKRMQREAAAVVAAAAARERERADNELFVDVDSDGGGSGGGNGRGGDGGASARRPFRFFDALLGRGGIGLERLDVAETVVISLADHHIDDILLAKILLELRRFKRLEVLDLSNNDITSVPRSIARLRLRSLTLTGNPLTGIADIAALSELTTLRQLHVRTRENTMAVRSVRECIPHLRFLNGHFVGAGSHHGGISSGGSSLGDSDDDGPGGVIRNDHSNDDDSNNDGNDDDDEFVDDDVIAAREAREMEAAWEDEEIGAWQVAAAALSGNKDDRRRALRFAARHTGSFVRGKLPAADWIPSYALRDNLVYDALAGATIVVFLIPQSMAYAQLAGLPPIHGLYSSFLPLVVYALFGTSRHLSAGPAAMCSLMVFDVLSKQAFDDAATYVEAANVLALICALEMILLGFLHLGFIVSFISRPVLSGFTSAAAILIGLSQLKHVFGVSASAGDYPWQTVAGVAAEWDDVNWAAFAIATLTCAILYAVKKLNEAKGWLVPAPLVVVLLFIMITWAADLENVADLPIVGTIPSGIPSFSVPSFTNSAIDYVALFRGGFVVVFVAYLEAISVVAKFGNEHKYDTDSNQEFIAIGLANIAAGLQNGYPMNGALSRTAMADKVGVRTQLAGMLTGLMVGVALLLLTSILYFMPLSVLAGMILFAIVGLVDYRYPVHLYYIKRVDMILLVATFLAVLLLGIDVGIVIGVLLSLSVVIGKSTTPHVAELGQIPRSRVYVNVLRFPSAVTFDGLKIFRAEGALYFANANFIKNQIKRFIEGSGGDAGGGGGGERPVVQCVIADFGSVSDIDSHAIEVLRETIKAYPDVHFLMAEVPGHTRDVLNKGKIVKQLGEDCFFFHVHDAVLFYHRYIASGELGVVSRLSTTSAASGGGGGRASAEHSGGGRLRRAAAARRSSDTSRSSTGGGGGRRRTSSSSKRRLTALSSSLENPIRSDVLLKQRNTRKDRRRRQRQREKSSENLLGDSSNGSSAL